jgi:hypothetical protein
MPYCAHCRWEYQGSPRYCRECGQRIFRVASVAKLVREWPPAAVPAWLETRSATAALFLAGVAGGAAFLLPGIATTQAALTGFPLDEAWVRLVYARALATEAQLAFNPGPPEAAVSSLLWVGLMAFLIKTIGALNLSVVALAKLVSLAAGGATAALAGRLGRRASGSATAGLLAGLLVAADPGFGYASASGVETTLFAALALGACLAFADGRRLLTGALLALATLTRFEGVILALLIGLATLVPLALNLRERIARRELPTGHDALVGLGVVVPAVLGFVLWGWMDGTEQDGIWPRALYLAVTAFTAPGLPDLVGLWRGYFASSVWAFVGVGPIAAAPLLAFGAWWLGRVWPRVALPLVLFPVVVALGAAAIVNAPAPWGFEQRRLIDPARPFLALLLVLGVRMLWELGQAWRSLRPNVALGRSRLVAALATGMALLPLAGMLPLWGRLPNEYAAAARGLNDTYFALARYAREALPAEALIVAIEPGTLRYVSRRPVADARGLHTRGLGGSSPLEAIAEARAEYAALPRLPLFESWPAATLVREFAPPPGLGTPAVGLYKVGPAAAAGSRDALHALPADALRRLDYLDVGSEAAERAHAYQVIEPRGTTRLTLRITPQRTVEDDGRAFVGGESLELAAEPGRDLIVARRFEASGAVLAVTVDGQPAGEWQPRASKYAVAEDTFRIPGGLVRNARAKIELRLLPGSAPRAISFGYWSFADR